MGGTPSPPTVFQLEPRGPWAGLGLPHTELLSSTLYTLYFLDEMAVEGRAHKPTWSGATPQDHPAPTRGHEACRAGRALGCALGPKAGACSRAGARQDTHTHTRAYPTDSARALVDSSDTKTWQANRWSAGCLVMNPKYLWEDSRLRAGRGLRLPPQTYSQTRT